MQNSQLSRRVFLSLPGAAAVLGATGLAANDAVRLGFVGVGNRGSYLLKHMMNVPGISVAALCDTNADTLGAAVAQAKAGGHAPDAVSDHRRILDRQDIDAVLIATPVDLHKEHAVASLEAGKHVYCEKPMALTPEECRAILNASKRAKGIYQAGFQLRHDPARSASMSFIHRGSLGNVLFCQGYRHTEDLPRKTAWYFDAKRSGNNIVEQACHILDLFTWAVGSHPLRAMGSGGINLYKNIPPGRTTMDNYAVIYEYPGDVRVCFSHIYFDPEGFSGIKERVFGSVGAIELPTATWRELEKDFGPIKLEIPGEGQDSTYLSLAAFIDNVRGRKVPLNNAESARRSTLVAMMGRKAMYEKRIVTWNEVDV